MNEIVLNEKEWAKRAIESLSLGKKPYETIVRVAKYYKSQGSSKADVRRKVEDFMIRCDPKISLVKWDGAIESAVVSAEKYPLININGIMITEPEMDKIKSLQSVIQQRLMFTLLCLAKYGNAVNSRNGGWVNLPQKDIFALANITLTTKRQSLAINDLWNAGMVGYSCLVDNINLQVKIIEDGNEALFIDDYRNLGNQYMRYLGGDYIECDGCGLVIRQQSKSSHQKYCKECASAVKAAMDADRNYINRLNRQFLKTSQATLA